LARKCNPVRQIQVEVQYTVRSLTILFPWQEAPCQIRHSTKKKTTLPTDWTYRFYFCKQRLLPNVQHDCMHQWKSTEEKACRLHYRQGEWYLCLIHVVLPSNGGNWMACPWRIFSHGQRSRPHWTRGTRSGVMVLGPHRWWASPTCSGDLSTYEITRTKPNRTSLSYFLSTNSVVQNSSQRWPSRPSGYPLWVYGHEWDFLWNYS
jgi:hypothetical protein